MRFSPKILRVAIPSPAVGSDKASVLAFAMAKGGSTLLFDILRKLCPHVPLIFFSIEDYLFRSGIASNSRPSNIGTFFGPEGYCYGGFRQFPAYPVPILHSTKVILLVRDPRDMLTSLYFSLLHSHEIPEEGAGGARQQMLSARASISQVSIDQYAIRAVSDYVRMFEGYIAQGFHWRPNVALYRYEDVIFSKKEWIADICSWFGWEISQEIIDEIASQVDVRVEGERPKEHIRQVTPGNYREHLNAESIQVIEKRLGEYMTIFGYL